MAIFRVDIAYDVGKLMHFILYSFNINSLFFMSFMYFQKLSYEKTKGFLFWKSRSFVIFGT